MLVSEFLILADFQLTVVFICLALSFQCLNEKLMEFTVKNENDSHFYFERQEPYKNELSFSSL